MDRLSDMLLQISRGALTAEPTVRSVCKDAYHVLRQSLSQETVREEVLEELLRRWVEAPMREGSWDYIELKGETERALKREPNAAAPAERKEPESMVANLGGAAAAPDVESMVKRLRAYANESGGAQVEQDLLEAAALLELFGQGS